MTTNWTTDWKFTFKGKTRNVDSESFEELYGGAEDWEDFFKEDFSNNPELKEELLITFDMMAAQLISDYLYSCDVLGEEYEEINHYLSEKEIMEKTNLPDTITFTDGKEDYEYDVELGVEEFLYNFDDEYYRSLHKTSK